MTDLDAEIVDWEVTYLPPEKGAEGPNPEAPAPQGEGALSFLLKAGEAGRSYLSRQGLGLQAPMQNVEPRED